MLYNTYIQHACIFTIAIAAKGSLLTLKETWSFLFIMIVFCLFCRAFTGLRLYRCNNKFEIYLRHTLTFWANIWWATRVRISLDLTGRIWWFGTVGSAGGTDSVAVYAWAFSAPASPFIPFCFTISVHINTTVYGNKMEIRLAYENVREQNGPCFIISPRLEFFMYNALYPKIGTQAWSKRRLIAISAPISSQLRLLCLL